MQGYWHLELLGEIRLTAQTKVVTRFSTQKVAALLTYLTMQMPLTSSRESLIEMFWPDQPLEAGRNSLSVALSSLRRQLGLPGVRAEMILTADRFQVGLNPAAVTSDAAEFERLLKAAEADPANRREHLTQAIALYRGDFAQGLYYDWAIREQVRFQTLYTEALLQLIAVLEQAGDYTEALPIAYRAVEVDCFSEQAHRALIRLLVASGRPTLALEAAHRLERLFEEEFGAEPSKTTRQLLVRLRQDPASVVSALSHSGSSLPTSPSTETDMSVSRHSPLSSPIFEPPSAYAEASSRQPLAPLDSGTEPAGRQSVQEGTKGVASAAVTTTNLPLRLTQMFGRTLEIEQIMEMLCPEYGQGSRLITLTGPGGTGKTRLAQEVGDALAARFAGRICFVALAEQRDPEAIPAAILQALTQRLSAEAELLAQAVDCLRLHPTLLILDNLEQLLEDEASSGSRPSRRNAGHLLYRLLEQVPSLMCLCTSRRRLGLAGEREYRVGPLPLPQDRSPVEQMAKLPSVQLYIDRAQAARVDFQLTPGNAASIGELCRRLEGMPLAIELAAAWVRTLPPRPMLERLQNRLALPEARYTDVPTRHRSLTAVFDWSYALLTPPQQRFFAQLALFTGGWTLEAATAVCAASDALELTEGLIGASLAHEAAPNDGNPRFRFLETVRTYSLQRLAASAEAAEVSKRFRNYYQALAQQAAERLEGPEQRKQLDLIQEEYSNLCAVLEADAADPAGGETGLRITTAIWRYWFIRGHLHEGVARLTAALAHPRASAWTSHRMFALLRRGSLFTHLHRYAEADADFCEVFALAEQIGDIERQNAVLNNRAIVKCRLKEYAPAEQLGMQALELSRRQGHLRMQGYSLGTLGVISEKRRDWATARRRLEACIAIFREIDNRHLVAVNLLNLAAATVGEGDADTTRTSIRECLELCGALGADKLLIDALLFVVSQQIQAQQWRETARLCGSIEGLQERLDIFQNPGNTETLLAASALAKAALAPEAFMAEFSTGRSLSVAEAVAYATDCSLRVAVGAPVGRETSEKPDAAG